MYLVEVVLDSPVTVLLDLDCVRQGEDTHVGLRQDGVVSRLLGERGDWTQSKIASSQRLQGR